MYPIAWGNRCSGSLAGAITNSQTTITLNSGQGAIFPTLSVPFIFPVILQSANNATTYEIAWCTGRSSDTLTVIRGQEGTAAQAFNQNDLVLLEPTAATLAGVSRAHGQCQLQYVSATSIRLVDYNGSSLIIQGVQQQIPSGGVSISNSGLGASTFYYVYAFMSGGSMALSLSFIGHQTDTTASNLGVEIMTGNNAYTLVGMIGTTSGSQFANGPTQRWVRSWFNRSSFDLYANASGVVSSTTPVELTTAFRTFFLNWANEVVDLSLFGTGDSNTAAQGFNVQLAIDNGLVGIPSTSTSPVAGYAQTCANRYVTGELTEGSHYATIFGSTFGGATITYGLSTIGRVG